MRVLRAVLVLLGALALQVVLSRLWPENHRWVNMLIVPVIWYGVAASQRGAMLVGCLAGLLHDAWFEFPVGVYGFKWTLIGWALGSLALRFDLNHRAGWLLAGILAWSADSLLDPLLRRLVDLQPVVRAPREVVIHALVTGLLAAVAGSIVERGRGREPAGRPL